VPPTLVDDDDDMIPEAAMGQVPRFQIPGGMLHRPDTRFRFELGD
jgi:hypothetical protein